MSRRPISDLDRAKVREARAAQKAEARFAHKCQHALDLSKIKK
jgi:hypothetical protein